MGMDNKMIQTTKEVVPVIYAYTTPEIVRHDRWTKIGDTGRETGKRLDEQMLTSDVHYNLEWKANAIYEGTNETFRDKDFHAYMQKQGIERLEGMKEDIFDYIPPQKTNQIYTPKKVVQQMVDYLEQENPNCFDDPNHTFIDLYMKSGLYITEIVKRLYRSEKMIELYPNEEDRLKHIFGNQVYGLAPTEIIYAIATHYILGFAQTKGMNITSKHFKMLDALPYAQGNMDMTLEEKLDELFGEDGE